MGRRGPKFMQRHADNTHTTRPSESACSAASPNQRAEQGSFFTQGRGLYADEAASALDKFRVVSAIPV